MVINVSVQCNGGLLPDIILMLTQCYYHRGTRRFGLCSLCSHLNVLTFLPLTGGCSEGPLIYLDIDAFRFFFKDLPTLMYVYLLNCT